MDEDLTEAIALGHDIGHTPFGHVGERTLNQITNGCDNIAPFQDAMDFSVMGFKHNLQSVRIACDLEKTYKQFCGMNLTNFALWALSIIAKQLGSRRTKAMEPKYHVNIFKITNVI